MLLYVAGTIGSVLIREVSLFLRSLIERFHCRDVPDTPIVKSIESEICDIWPLNATRVSP